MPRIPTKQKAALGESLVAYFRQFGTVAPRRAYHDEDESGTGTGSAKPPWEAHPMFLETPIGAPSDLASILVADERTVENAENRMNEACPELRMQLEYSLKQKEEYRLQQKIAPTPY